MSNTTRTWPIPVLLGSTFISLAITVAGAIVTATSYASYIANTKTLITDSSSATAYLAATKANSALPIAIAVLVIGGIGLFISVAALARVAATTPKAVATTSPAPELVAEEAPARAGGLAPAAAPTAADVVEDEAAEHASSVSAADEDSVAAEEKADIALASEDAADELDDDEEADTATKSDPATK